MENRFKLRTWDGKNNDMIYGRFPYDMISAISEMKDAEFEHLTFMQCTGMTDSEGQLIFEGDIMGCKDPDDDPSKWQIVYEAPSFRIKFDEWDKTLDYPVMHDQKWISKYDVILGNIYETPHLLKAAS